MSKQTPSTSITILTTLVINALLATVYYLWQIKGVEQAGNIFIFWVWFVSVIGVLAIFITPTANDYKRRTVIQHIVRFIVSPLILLATLWAGHIFAATVYAIAVLAAESRHNKAKELAEAACPSSN